MTQSITTDDWKTLKAGYTCYGVFHPVSPVVVIGEKRPTRTAVVVVVLVA